jgi:hypothetical protein
LKYVRGFDERYHCERCLKGRRSRRFHYDRRSTESGAHFDLALDEFDAPFVYLCGVASHYEENVHVALRSRPGASVFYEDARIRVEVKDGERLPIYPVETDKPYMFKRCRNYQFGLAYLAPKSSAGPNGLPPVKVMT